MKEGGSRSEVQRWKTGRGGPGLRGPGEETLWGGEEGKEKGASPLCRWEIRPEMPAAAATVEKRSTRSVVSFFSSARIIPLNGSVLLSLSLIRARHYYYPSSLCRHQTGREMMFLRLSIPPPGLERRCILFLLFFCSRNEVYTSSPLSTTGRVASLASNHPCQDLCFSPSMEKEGFSFFEPIL